MANRGFQFRLYPNDVQASALAQTCGVVRLVWNIALEQRRHHARRYKNRMGTSLNYVAQARELTVLRDDVSFVRDVHVTPLQRCLKELDRAYKAFWAGNAGPPSPRKKHVHMSFSHAGREVQVRPLNKNWASVRIPKIGWLKFRKTRDIPEDVREVTVSKTALGWNVTFGCVVPDQEDTKPGSVGIDRGVDIPLALSDARVFGEDLKIRLLHLERRARFLQRRVSRRKKGSNRYRRAVKHLSKIKAKIARVRKHWAHCVTSWITQSYGTVVIEDLKTKNMTRSNRGTIEAPGRKVRQNSGRNRAILNIGWHQIEQMLSYKAGRLVKVDPRYTSQTCSTCGTQDKTSRKSQAVFDCTNCGFRANADINAAINILMRGNDACLDVEPVSRDRLKRLLEGANRPLKIPVL